MRRLLVLALSVGLLLLTVMPAGAVQIDRSKTFSRNGVTPLNVNNSDSGYDVVADGNDAYLIGATFKNSDHCSFLVAKYDERGRLIRGFASHGVKVLRVGDTGCATDGALLPDGTLLVAGWSVRDRRAFANVVAIRPSGRVDRTFGTRGIVEIRSEGGVWLPLVDAEPSGAIWLSWTRYTNYDKSYGNYEVAHLKPSGAKDRNFGHGGVKTFDRMRKDFTLHSTVDSNGRLYLTGWSASTQRDSGTAALLSVSDSGGNHMRVLNAWKSGTYPISIDVDAADKVVVGLTPSVNPGWGAARLDSELRLDDTYGRQGISKHDCHCYSYAGALTDNGLVLIGTTMKRDQRTIAARFSNTGRWDRQAAKSGPWNFAKTWENPSEATVDESGRVLIAGTGRNRTRDAFIARLVLK